jgi:hypothetical protein
VAVGDQPVTQMAPEESAGASHHDATPGMVNYSHPYYVIWNLRDDCWMTCDLLFSITPISSFDTHLNDTVPASF